MNRLIHFGFVILLLALPGSLAQSDNFLDLDKIKEHIDLDKIKEHLPAGIEIPDIETLKEHTKTLEDTQNVLREKCIKVSGSDAAFEEAQQAVQVLTSCVQSLVNITEIQIEIEEAKPKGELETVFNKYCKRRNTAIECVANFTEAIDPCLEPTERESKKTIVDIATGLVNFVCHKDGDQIALFIAEKGPECLTDKKDGIVRCLNDTFGSYVPKESPKTIDEVPTWSFGEKECRDINTLKLCVVAELESCEESTPANLVDAMFRFVRNKTPCVNYTTAEKHKAHNEEADGGSASHLASFFVIVGATFLTLMTTL